MIDTLRELLSSGRIEQCRMRGELVAIITRFMAAGAAAGDLRSDVDPVDVAARLTGVLTVAGTPDQRDQAARMLALVVDGLHPHARPPSGQRSASS